MQSLVMSVAMEEQGIEKAERDEHKRNFLIVVEMHVRQVGMAGNARMCSAAVDVHIVCLSDLN